MNKEHRTRLSAVLDQLEQLSSLLENIRYSLSSVLADEEAAYDALPESLKLSDRGCTIEANCDALADIINDLDLDVQDIYSRIEDLLE